MKTNLSAVTLNGVKDLNCNSCLKFKLHYWDNCSALKVLRTFEIYYCPVNSIRCVERFFTLALRVLILIFQ